jgi:Tfp pilus assembly protein PilF
VADDLWRKFEPPAGIADDSAASPGAGGAWPAVADQPLSSGLDERTFAKGHSFDPEPPADDATNDATGTSAGTVPPGAGSLDGNWGRDEWRPPHDAAAPAGPKNAVEAARRLRSRRIALIGTVGTVVLVLASVFGYIYLQVGSAPAGPDALRPNAVLAPGAASAPLTALPESGPAPAPAAQAQRPWSAPPERPPAPAPATPVARQAEPGGLPLQSMKQPGTNESDAAQVQAPDGQDSPRDRIDIRRNNSVSLDPALQGAYRSYLAGDAATARTLYQKVLAGDRNNRDALLGMAAIAIREGKDALARDFYAQLLALDPVDPDAMAGLSSLQQASPESEESGLKKALARTPQSAPVLFALGNVYAQQSRWSEAQQAYFRAYTNAADNPDYAMNLAISLDRLGQGRLALDYYQRALTLAANGRASFKRDQVQARIAQLGSAAVQPN